MEPVLATLASLRTLLLPRRPVGTAGVALVVVVLFVLLASSRLLQSDDAMAEENAQLRANLSAVLARAQSLDTAVSELASRMDRLRVVRRRSRRSDKDDYESAVVDGAEGGDEEEETEVAVPMVASGLVYQGCFADAINSRDLPSLMDMFSVSPHRCAHECAARDFAYAGLQDGAECWCGATFGTQGTSTACSRACTGDPAMRCGGPFANDVYSSALNPERAAPVPLTLASVANDSSVSCWQNFGGKRAKDLRARIVSWYRTCTFANLYMHGEDRAFYFQFGPDSVVNGVELREGEMHSFLDLTSLGAHPMKLNVVSRTALARVHAGAVLAIDRPLFMLSRFLPANIMHCIHDDLIPLYHTMAEAAQRQSANTASDPDVSSSILLLDDHAAGDYFSLLQLFSNHPVIHQRDLHLQTMHALKTVTAGLSNKATWYQYGFSKPQGPIERKTVNGEDVRRVSRFILRRAHIRKPETPVDIVVFSRSRNRRIVNELDLLDALKRRYPTQNAQLVRLEEMGLIESLRIVAHAKVAIGMHGSILILTMFMPSGSTVVELYPFAVPAKNYTPYRTMANLAGMGLHYAAWENKHKDKTTGFPERHRLLGGLKELPAAKRKEIRDATAVPPHLCCEDPFWLYKIFQDTQVTIPEVMDLLEGTSPNGGGGA